MSLMFNNLYSYYKLFTNNTYANNYIYYRKAIEEELKEINKYNTRRLYGNHKFENKTNKKKKNKYTNKTSEINETLDTSEIVDQLDLLEKGILQQQKLQEELQKEIQLIIDESLYNIVDREESDDDAYTLV